MTGLVRNKFFWEAIALCSILIAIYVSFFYESDYDRIKKSKKIFICFSEQSTGDYLTLRSVDNEKEVQDYMDFVYGKTKNVNFKSGAVWGDQTIYLYKKHDKYNLAEIIVTRDNPTISKSGIEKFWIWTGYLQKEPCK